ncbi:hypothetical protein OHC33_010982 [Knufia fluminis]|uniref:Uncharacterized protein n=1 Tax=Knufia fluminis TaxID=191047 RepID=A0AAN8EMC9_9EURO|nr:hypothetical protein OHC33_010982 [Knufia fluminis]
MTGPPGQWEPQESWLHEHEDTVDESQVATPADPVRYDEAASRASPAPPSQRLRSRKPRRSLQDRLPLLQLEDWDPEREYARDSPTCVHYDLEWKVTSNGKQIPKDTERNLVLGPASFWQRTLRSRLDRLVGRKMGDGDAVKADETSIIVSVTDRAERDLAKRFDELDIDWPLSRPNWWNGNHTGTVPASRTGARGRVSATQRMLASRNTQLQAEEASQGCPPAWAETYEKMRCLQTCPQGPHCWCDPHDKRHYKLSTYHLRKLVKGYPTRSVRRSASGNQSEAQSQGSLPAGMTPITINNHFPETSLEKSSVNSTGRSAQPDTNSSADCVKSPLNVSGYLDTAVRRYTEWQRSRFEDAELKNEMTKACSVISAHGLTLAQVHDDQDFQFLIDNGVKRGTARHFVGDIKMWTKQYQEDRCLRRDWRTMIIRLSQTIATIQMLGELS